jgi:acyl-CoA synthetase (AMP-forming)/AMP-acid ligase II
MTARPPLMTIAETLSWQAAHRPGKRAFVFLDRGEREAGSLTFAELDSRARVIAGALRDSRLTGKRVILAYPSGLEFVAALFGCFYAGAIAVPAPTAGHGNALDRVTAIARDADAAATLTLRPLLANQPETSPTPCIATDELPDDTGLTDTAWGEWHLPAPGDLALLQYTSGSTGNPRGVMLSHANLAHQQRVLDATLGLSSDDIAVSWLPLYHDMGLVGGLLHAVNAGVLSVLMSPLAFLQQPMRWLSAISRYRATISMAPCFAYALAVRRHALKPVPALDLACWRVAICGGEPVRPHLLQAFAESFRTSGFDANALLPAYGLAEATLLAAAPQLGRRLAAGHCIQAGNDRASCGSARDNHKLTIVDPETRRRLSTGEQGEIWFQGPSVATGYWNRPDETAAVFQAELPGEPEAGRWLRTGDLGFLTDDGLVVTGRRKEIIVVRGANFDPADIELAARDSHAALMAGGGAAFAVDLNDAEGVVLVHECDRTAMREIDPASLAQTVAAAVNRRFGLALHDLVLIRPGTLPRTTSGKVKRYLCQARYRAGSLASFGPIETPALGRCRPAALAVT